MMSPCGSRTRRSTRRSTSKDAGRCAVSLSRACAPGGRCASRGPAPQARGKKFVTPEVLISERPAEADDRAVPGHWEGDLIIGLDSSAIGTLVERTTRFTMLLHLPPMPGHGSKPRVKNGPPLAGHGAEAVRDAIATTDHHAARATATLADLGPGRRDGPARPAAHRHRPADLLRDPHSPWQRGTNENTNGLLRQYFPKGTDLTRHSLNDLDGGRRALNNRPRKTLGWRTPAEAFEDHLRSAA